MAIRKLVDEECGTWPRGKGRKVGKGGEGQGRWTVWCWGQGGRVK